jgi:hypothetical protein
MIVVSTRAREKCEGCSKNILTHHKFAACSTCRKISHANCTPNIFEYNQIKDSWSCCECSSRPSRYSPFDDITADKHDQYSTTALHELDQMTTCLKSCTYSDTKHLNKLMLEQNQEQMSICFNNIDGVKSNFDRLSIELSAIPTKPSAIALAETNLDSCNKDLFKLDGYQSVYQSKMATKNKGSGLAIYILDKYISNTREEFSSVSKNMETLFITISNTSEPLTIGAVYRPPNGDVNGFTNELEALMQKLPNKNVIITGDFNIDLLKKRNTGKFEEVFFGNSFIPLISIATHYKPDCNPSCIDNILTNSPHKITYSTVYENTITHHRPIFCGISIGDAQTETDIKTLPRYDYNDTNMNTFNEKLKQKLETDKYPHDEDGFNKFLTTVNTLTEECFVTEPVSKTSRRNRFTNPWITNGIIASVKQKNHLYKKWRRTTTKNDQRGDHNMYETYKQFRKTLKSVIVQAKKSHYLRKFNKVIGNSKKTWELINDLRGKRQNQAKPSFMINSELVKDRRKIADAFNNFFASIAENMNQEAKTNNTHTNIPDASKFVKTNNTNSMYMSPCTVDEISSIITDLDNNKASDIPIRVIKSCNQIISPYLNELLNTFIEKGVFPQVLKIGKISPIHKKGDPQLLDNYRPVSTLPIFGKIFEKIIYSRIYKFLIANNILYDKQFGFRKSHSTSHAVNYSIHKITDSIENKKHIIGIFIDLSKAFDTINHNLLFTKLEMYGIRGIVLTLIKNYLENRDQHTKFHTEISGKKVIKYGVPQGSVLGPLLFLIYINDIINSSNEGHFVLFADDTNIFIVADTIEEAYQKANIVLLDVHKYLLANQLHINLSKCTYMHFSPTLAPNNRLTCARTRQYDEHKNLTLSVNSKKIKKVDCVRFLGVIIDDKLNWSKHIEHLEKKLLSCIVLIKRIKDCIPKSQYLTIYHSLFLSHLTYCISSWGGVAPNKLQKIFATQKRCIRLLFGKIISFDHPEFYLTCARVRTFEEHKKPKDYCLEHTKPLFTKNGLLTVHNLYQKHTFMECFKVMKYKTPIAMYQLLTPNQASHRNLLICPKVHLTISKDNFLFKASQIWNYSINKILDKPDIDPHTNLLIPGSVDNSDLTTSVPYTKNKITNLLLDTQKQGDEWEWLNTSFSPFMSSQ